jgi:hypothetical protein
MHDSASVLTERVQMRVPKPSALIAAPIAAFAVGLLAGYQAAEAQDLAHCKADAERICPGVAPGGGKLIACLKQHQDDVSIGCGKALKAIKTKMGK